MIQLKPNIDISDFTEFVIARFH